MMRRRGDGMAGLPLRRLHGGGEEVVDEAASLDIAELIVGDLLEERGGQAHGEPPVHLSLDDHGIDDISAVVDGEESTDLHLTRALVDVDHAYVAAKGV